MIKKPMLKKGNVKQVDNTPAADMLPKSIDDATLLKVDHTHAGIFYKKGTPLTELNPSDSTIDFMQIRDII